MLMAGDSQPCESLKSPWQVHLRPSSVNHRNQHMCRSDPLCQQPSTILSHACLVGDQEGRVATRHSGDLGDLGDFAGLAGTWLRAWLERCALSLREVVPDLARGLAELPLAPSP